jgi:hypothetical protein
MSNTTKLNWIRKVLGQDQRFQREKKFLFLNWLFLLF